LRKTRQNSIGVVLVVLSILSFLAPTSDANACSCQVFETKLSNYFVDTDAVFAGTVLSVETWPVPTLDYDGKPLSMPMKWIVFDVEALWSGPSFSRLPVYSPGTIAACGVDFSVGDRFLVRANYSNTNPVWLTADVPGI